MIPRRPTTPRRPPALRRSGLALAALGLVAATTAACDASGPPARSSAIVSVASQIPSLTQPPAPSSTSPPSATRTPPARPSHTRATHTRTRHPSQTPKPTPAAPSADPRPVVPAGSGPVIVIDPGHSRSISATDRRTGLDVSDYENEPEMRDVFAVAKLVRAKLERDGYRVVMTKTHVGQRRSLADRAAIANEAHAALALSIHDQAGSNGGIGFNSGNNIVYYQSVGDYRSNSSGQKFYFTRKHVAALSRKYGRIFRDQRERVEGQSTTLLGNAGYNLGSRGLAGGNIWMVQLLSRVPWIYNESGGNSAGQSGLDAADKHTYADGLVAGVEHCIPPPY